MFALRDNVYSAISNDRSVLLDLAADRYHALTADVDAAFRALMETGSVDERDQVRLTPLIKRELLVPAIKASFPKKSYPLPQLSFLDIDERPRPTAKDVFDSVSIQIATMVSLKRRPLIELVAQLRRRKQAARRFEEPRRDRMVQIAFAFTASERILPSHNQCLRRSLALACALNSKGFKVDFVIGVRMNPFGAHAWVQDSGTLLNDDLDVVRKFQPILVV